MRGTVLIGGEKVEMLAVSSNIYRYRQVFHEDFLLISRKLSEEEDEANRDAISADTFIKMGYIMAMQASGEDMNKLNYETFIEWLDQFEPNAVLAAVGEIAKIYKGQEKRTSVPKKKGVQQNAH